MFKKILSGLPFSFQRDEIDLFSNAGNYLVGDVISRGIVFLTIPIYTRILAPDELGVVAVFQSLVYMFSIVYSCGVPGAITRYYYEEKKDFNSFLGNNVLFAIVFSVILSLIIFLLRNPI